MKTLQDKKVNKKRLEGIVTSDKMDKTIVVNVTRYIKHPKYGKFYTVDKKFKAHDEKNIHKIGDKVTIEETRPISKDKSFVVVDSAVVNSK